MNKQYEPLFTPWKIGNVEIKNRIVQTSMGGTSLFGWLEPCHFDKEAAHHILERAKENVGLVLPGMQCVRDTMGGRWLHTNKKMFRDLAEWLPEFHKTGAKLFVQISAGMGRSMAVNDMMVLLLKHKALGAIAKPFLNVEAACASCSATPNRWRQDYMSRPMTLEEIRKMIHSFAETAKLLQDAGVDGVEIHAVHEGYLLDQFTMKNWNSRTDEYGGSFENRYRFATDIVKAIKARCGADFPVALRYSVVSKTKGWFKGAVPGEAFEEFGRDMEESEKAIKHLEEAGYDMFDCDNGTYDAWYWAHPPVYMLHNCNLEDVEHIKQFTTKPVVCAGKMTLEAAAESIAAGRLDGMGTARQNLVDPEWVTKVMEGREAEIKPCINCHNACFNFAKSKSTSNTQPLWDSLHLSRCALTPPTMQHNKYKIVPTTNPKKVAIIGAGIAGMECALVLKKRGHTPVLFEKSGRLGGLYVTASAMSFKSADKQLLVWYENELKKAGIEIRFHTEIKSAEALRPEFQEILVCTGAVPKALPVPGFEKCIGFEELLIQNKGGERIVFFGGGQSSCEAAYEMVLQGKKPVIVEYADDLIVTAGTCLANSSFLRDMLEYQKVPVYLEHTIKEIGDGFVLVASKDGAKEFKIECDSVVNGIGFKPAASPIEGKKVGTAVKWGNLRDVIWNAWDVCMKI